MCTWGFPGVSVSPSKSTARKSFKEIHLPEGKGARASGEILSLRWDFLCDLPTHLLWFMGKPQGDRDTDATGHQGCTPGAGHPAGRAPGPGLRPGPTGVRAQVAGERVPPAAGVVAEVALEGLLPRVQLDVAQQVALLCEGGPTLVALEGTLSWGETGW